MQIPPSQLRWYAAFHDEGEHPHIHMMLWSDDPKYGFLRKDKLLHLQSALTNMIYADKLKEVYIKKDIAYKEVTEAAWETMHRIVGQLESVENPPEPIQQKLLELALELRTVSGKMQYGYLKKPLKDKVDSSLRQSMPRKGNCWDNAPQESFFGHMKDELAEKIPNWTCFADVQRSIDDWMDYYNNDRYQWDLAKLSPNEYYQYLITGSYPC